MISPHARTREWRIFTIGLDEDRARRWAGLTERATRVEGHSPFAGRRLLDEMKARIRPVVQANYFNGG